jgi:pSer/pThr/pTyr-binding forkhead associated (FHA) protein
MTPPHSSSIPDDPGSSIPEFNSQSPAGLAEILQSCCQKSRSGQIGFQSGRSSGFVYLQHGRVIHAICGAIEGEEAVYRMLVWPAGSFSLDSDVLPHKKTITLSWEQLLLEGARRADDIKRTTDPVNAVVISQPIRTSRTSQNQPRLTLTLPDQRPIIYDLEAEYTYLGRANGNDIPLSDPSVSNRHCIFVLTGSDVVLRDLNSSNGTIVNGQSITEVALRPGDLIQVGVVQIKFEPGVLRPKLTQSFGDGSILRDVPERTAALTTLKLPFTPSSSPPAQPPPEAKPDSAFVKGETAISFENIAKPEPETSRRPMVLLLVGILLILVLLGGGYYFFFLK